MSDIVDKVVQLSDGLLSSRQIAEHVGASRRYVSRIQQRLDLPRLTTGPPRGERNPAWVGGRSIDLDGYALVPTPAGVDGRGVGRILEHRLVMSRTLGRPLTALEVVDHIDGLTLHNAPPNLRLFANNAEHLQATLTGKIPKWSPAGRARGRRGHRPLPEGAEPVDSYRLRKERGDVRLRAICLAALSLGIGSPHLCGTRHWLAKAGTDGSSRSSLERALQALHQRWAQDPALSG